MTREQIEQMPAGREMDALIAEKVFGYVWMHNKRYSFVYPPGDADALAREGFAMRGKHPEHEIGARLDAALYYSTDIAAAWQVVDAKMSEGFVVKMWGEAGRTVHFECTIDGDHWTNPEHHWVAQGDSAPLAICRAALLASL